MWYGTNYKVDAEPNNGRGQADFIVSFGQKNQNIVEFKLASNSNLSHVFQQVQVYEAANCCDGSLIAIFYFSESEYQTAMKVVKDAGYEHSIDESIFLIDCRNDNKTSASKVWAFLSYSPDDTIKFIMTARCEATKNKIQ